MDSTQTPARRLLFLGDSITDCGRLADPAGFGTGFVRRVVEELGMGSTRAMVINRGISGHRARDLRERFRRDVLAEEPDVLTVYVGVNDTWRRYDQDDPTHDEDFSADVNWMLGTFAAERPDADIYVMLPFVADVDTDKARYHEDLDGKVSRLRDLAEAYGARVVDLEQTLADALAGGMSPADFAPDGVHPSPEGHRLLAAAWLRAYRGADDGVESAEHEDSSTGR